MTNEHPTRDNTPEDVVQSVKDFRDGREARISTMRSVDHSGTFTADGGLRNKPKRKPAKDRQWATA